MNTITTKKNDYFLKISLLVFSLSSIVLIEPSPFDLGILILFLLGWATKAFFLTNKISIPLFFLFLFTLSSLVSMFGMGNFLGGIRYFSITIYMIVIWLFIILFINRYKERGIDVFWKGYTIAAVFSVALGLLSYFGLIPFQETLIYANTRIKSLFKDPNVFGPFLVPVAIYSFSKLNALERKSKFKWLIVFALCALGILLSFSRGAWGNFGLALGLYIAVRFLVSPSPKFAFRLLLSGILLLPLLYWTLSIDSIELMFQERFAYQQYDQGRFLTHAFALEVIKNTPLGVGSAQYDYIYGYMPHNSYLQVAVENGWLALVGYLGLIIASLHKSFKQYIITKNNLYLIVFSSIWGLLLNAYFVDTLHWRHFWILLALPWVSLTSTKSTLNLR